MRARIFLMTHTRSWTDTGGEARGVNIDDSRQVKHEQIMAFAPDLQIQLEASTNGVRPDDPSSLEVCKYLEQTEKFWFSSQGGTWQWCDVLGSSFPGLIYTVLNNATLLLLLFQHSLSSFK